MKILIFGLPGSGKTYLAELLSAYFGNKAKWFNADKVRDEANDWDFSDEGRLRQSKRMFDLCEEAESHYDIVIADFIAPFEVAREQFDADYEVFMDTIDAGRYEDTNKIFEKPANADYIVTDQRGDIDAKIIAYDIGQKFLWDNQAPTTQMLGRFQPWHHGHQILFERALDKHGQVNVMIRDMPHDNMKNPYVAPLVKENLIQHLHNYAGQVKIDIVPNIMNITYGRDVGYKIEQEHLGEEIESISATEIRRAEHIRQQQDPRHNQE
tara:strand:- start:755 stop:1555 length:801 start_codon:yes stop_codon:yes gene_type:complete